MRLSFLAASILVFSLNFARARENSSPADQEQVSAAAVIREINLAREMTSGLFLAAAAITGLTGSARRAPRLVRRNRPRNRCCTRCDIARVDRTQRPRN